MPASYEPLQICITRPRFQSCSMAAQETGSNYSRSRTSVSDDHEGSVSIGGWLITNFRFADDIVNKCRRGRSSCVLVERHDTTITRYKMEIGPDKTRVMTNNPNGFQREIKIRGQRLKAVENFKYVGAIISNKGSKLEILSRIAQTTAALSRLKIIWRDKNISLAFTVKLMRTLILSTVLYACKSWTLTAELEIRIQTLEMRCCRRLLNNGEEAETWPSQGPLSWRIQFCMGLWKEQEAEEDRRDGKITSRNGQEWSLENGRRGKVERYCCNVIRFFFCFFFNTNHFCKWSCS